MDKAGNVGSGSLGFKYDATPPTVTLTPDRTPDKNGWYNHQVNFAVSGSDATSGTASCTQDFSYSGPDNASKTVSATCADNAGNSASQSSTFAYDATPPTGVSGVADRVPDSNGWYNHGVAWTFNGSDAISGIGTCTQTTYSGPDSATASVSGTCTDQAGNTSSEVPVTFKYDATPPVVTLSVVATYCLGGANPGYTATDATSGIASKGGSSTVSTTASGAGKYTYTATATDVAGNKSTLSQDYIVTYVYKGLLPPITADGRTTFKLGSGIPVKFQVFKCDGITPVTNADAHLEVDFGSGAVLDDQVISLVDAYDVGNTFRYAGQQYIFNWGTKGLWTGSYVLIVKLDDTTRPTGELSLR